MREIQERLSALGHTCDRDRPGEFGRGTLAAVRAFRAPMAMVMEEIETEGTLDASVIAMGKVYVGTELGGGGVLTPETVDIAETGIRNVLIHFGVMEGEPETAAWRGRTESRMMEVPMEVNRRC